MHILCCTAPSICQRTVEQQLHMSGFLCVMYAILNALVILKRNETCLERNEKLSERNETRGGNLLLSGTVTEYPGFKPVCLEKWSLPMAGDRF